MDNAGVRPDMVQVGNETNDGMCWEFGRISKNGWSSFVSLTNSGKNVVKDFSSDISILMQYAGTGQNTIENINYVKGLFYWGATWTQADKWLSAPGWSDDNAQANNGVNAVIDAGGLQVIGVDVSEAHYSEDNGVTYLDL